MKRVSPALIVMFIAALGCAATELLASYYQSLYHRTTAKAIQSITRQLNDQEFTDRLNSYYQILYHRAAVEAIQSTTPKLKDQELSERLDRREAEEPRDLMAVRYSGEVVTTDQPLDYEGERDLQMAVTNGQQFHFYEGKGNGITSKIRLSAGSTNVYELDMLYGNAVDVWLTYAEPYDALAAFQQFHVYRTGTNTLRLVVQLKPAASTKMRFGLVVLREKLELYQ
jgi:hypothetical protein